MTSPFISPTSSPVRSIAGSPARKLGLLSSLYFSQGLPFGFFYGAMPVLLREADFELTTIGLTSLLAIPWAVKFLWAPLVDRYRSFPWGPRKSWIVPLQLLSALTLVGVAFTDLETSLGLVLVGVLCVNFLAATQDISTDAFAVDLLDYRERGLGNGIQYAAYRVGMIVGGGILVATYDILGWRETFLLMAGLLTLATVPVIMAPEARIPRGESSGSLFEKAVAFLCRPNILVWLIPLALYKAGDDIGSTMLKPMLVDHGISKEDIGWMVGTLGSAGALIGALVGGYAAGRWGRHRTIIVFGIFQAFAVGTYFLPAIGYDGLVTLYFLCGIEHFAGGTATAALFALMMDFCSAETAATDYTLQASVVVIAKMLAGAASGFIAQATGYPALFLISATLSLLGVFAIRIGFSIEPSSARHDTTAAPASV